MKKMFVSLCTVLLIVALTATCSGPSLVYTGELKRNDTIFVVTQPGFSYQISVIPENPKLKIDPNFEPIILLGNMNIKDIRLSEENGIMYDVRPCMDTIHIVTIITQEGVIKKSCWEPDGDFFFDCDGVEVSTPCTEDVTIDCDDY